MAIDTAEKRQASHQFGRRIGTRTATGSSSAFLRGVTLALFHFEASLIPTYSITRRGTLYGQSNERRTLYGQSNERGLLIGQSNERRTLTGYDE